MKQILAWLGCSILATGMAMAQDATSSTPGAQDQNTQTRTQSTTTQSKTVRGCLSGSSGNYTVTDQNGTQWTVAGDDTTLRNSVGRKVEIRFAQNQSSDESNQGASTTRTTHTVQASQVTALSESCSSGGINPSGSSGSTEPQSPRMMSMLMQQSAPGQSQSGAAGPPQATPPVTSQTPANSPSPAKGANSQVGTSPANDNGMTGSETNHDAQAARQGELNTNPQTGDTTGRGVNNQGVNNSTSTSPNAAPTSQSSATPSSNAQQPQADSNDQNKPLYERQATDIPRANGSGGNKGTANPPH